MPPQKSTGLEAKLLATYPNLAMIFVWEALWSNVFLGWNWLVGLVGFDTRWFNMLEADSSICFFSNDDEKYDF